MCLKSQIKVLIKAILKLIQPDISEEDSDYVASGIVNVEIQLSSVSIKTVIKAQISYAIVYIILMLCRYLLVNLSFLMWLEPTTDLLLVSFINYGPM